MKKVIRGKELREKMEEAIALLCGTVKQTLGPMGRNVIIDHSSFNPFITNDGVTIAKNIESDVEGVGAILEIAKEASIKTDENVGDGTTTTLVILEALINLSQNYIDEGINPLTIKKKLTAKLDFILSKLEELKYEATLENLKNIACVSSGDEKMGMMVGEILHNIDDKEAIIIKEKNFNVLDMEFIKGYSCLINHPSEYYFQDRKNIRFDLASILIINGFIGEIDSISDILNEAILSNRALVIVARDFDPIVVNEIVALNLEGKINCFMIKISEYGLKERIIQKDLEIITGAHIVEENANITGDNIGIVKNLYLDREILKMSFREDIELNNYIHNIETELESLADEFDKEFYKRRRAMFKNGMVEVSIGSPTKTECREKRMRLDDAICSANAAKKGIVHGGGVALLKIAEDINIDDEASSIWKEALMKPFEQIMINAALDSNKIKEQIRSQNFHAVYNICTNEFENINNTNIVDAFLVVRNSLINACSIAGMLLTTTSLVINEYQNNINKIADYGEL
ncbi:MAG: hypothetical protein OSJ70_00735 [Bacilli bacterium]|nr:hypothetical protein [Bacilli bacterium]